MTITVLQSGFVTGDFLDPVAYAGEMNSRVVEITHPLFDNSYYQLLIVKESRPYVLGVENGKFMLPPSLTDVACTLECQFMALRKNSGIDITSGNCACYPVSSNDCSNMIFKSNKFNMIVAEGLNINGLTPIPPYEQLVDMYNNLSKAKLAVENAKIENENIANTINDKINQLQSSNYLTSLKHESDVRHNEDVTINTKLDSLINMISILNTKIDEKSIYKINYYDDNGNILETQYKRHNESVYLTSMTPTDENKIFMNWKDVENNTYNPSALYNLNKDLNLYVVWE